MELWKKYNYGRSSPFSIFSPFSLLFPPPTSSSSPSLLSLSSFPFHLPLSLSSLPILPPLPSLPSPSPFPPFLSCGQRRYRRRRRGRVFRPLMEALSALPRSVWGSVRGRGQPPASFFSALCFLFLDVCGFCMPLSVFVCVSASDPLTLRFEREPPPGPSTRRIRTDLKSPVEIGSCGAAATSEPGT